MVCHTGLKLLKNSLARLTILSMVPAGILGAQALSMVSGNGQLTASQFKITQPLVVRATDGSGHPVPGVTVNWKVATGPGYMQDQSTTTDGNGLTRTYFTGIAPESFDSLFPSTITATAGSSSVSFFATTVQFPGSATVRVVTPSVGAMLTAKQGSTISGAVQVQIYVTDGFQSGAGIPNVGFYIVDYNDPTATPSASCNGPNGTVLTDATGTATCDLVVNGPVGTSQLLGILGGYRENPSFYLTITPGATCTYSLSASSQSFSAAGGTGTVNVNTTSGCGWTAASNANFIGITSALSGNGNGSVSYSVAANTGAARTGILTIAGQTYTVNQAAPNNPSGPTVTTQSLPVGSVGAQYNATLTASGGQPPYSWSITGSLPSGLTLTPSTGVISGIPGSAGQYGFTATVTDSAAKTASASLSISVNGTSSGSFSITNVSFANGVPGQPYSQPLTVANFCSTPFSHNVNFAVSSGSLPPGLSISNNPDGSHSISGTPSTAGAFPFTLKATDTCGNVATASFTILVGQTSGGQQMTVNVPSLTFNAQLGAALPADQSLSVMASSSALNYTVAVATSSGVPWLVLKNGSSGTTPGAIVVGIANLDKLTANQYNGSVTITSAATNSPVVVPVTLTVAAAAPPSIVLQSPASFSETQVASSSPESTPVNFEQIILQSTGGPVNFTVSASTNDGSPWLTALPAQGTTPAAVTAIIDSGGLAPGRYSGTVTIKPAVGASIPVVITVTVIQATPTLTSVVNGASFAPGAIAPGEIITIFGTAMGPLLPSTLKLDSSGKLATTLAGTQVTIGGYPAPLIYSSAGQVSVIVPYEITGNVTTSVVVQYLSQRSSTVTVPVAASAPGIFIINSSNQGAILNQDASVNGIGNGAEPGSVISIFATGEGQTSPGGIDGSITQGALPVPLLSVTVQIAGQDAQVIYAGAAPLEPAGVLQVNAIVPAGVQRGVSAPISIKVGNSTSPAGPTIAIKP